MPAKKNIAKKGTKSVQLTTAYKKLLSELKTKIRSCQIKAMTQVNSELILLYCNMGKDIDNRFKKEGWGAKVIDRLSKDLKNSFPEMSGFSPRNLRYMRKFTQIWSKSPILQQVAAKLKIPGWDGDLC